MDKPLGSEVNSYCYRDVNGELYYNGKSKKYGESYSYNDTIGILLIMSPPLPKQFINLTENLSPVQSVSKDVRAQDN